jgi:hypothetical protein
VPAKIRKCDRDFAQKGDMPHASVKTMAQAHDYMENELSAGSFVAENRIAVIWDNERVSLLDFNVTVFEWLPDYTSEPTRRRREIRKQALNKLSEEERESLGFKS